MTGSTTPADVVDDLRRWGIAPGGLIAVAVPNRGLLESGGACLALVGDDGFEHVVIIGGGDAAAVVSEIDAGIRPRWVMWSNATALTLVRAGVRVATCWDIAAVHRLHAGGWRAAPGRVWAHVHGLDADALPEQAPVDLFSSLEADDDVDDPVRPDGHLRPEWISDDWAWTPERLVRWARLALDVARRQQQMLGTDERAAATARAESTAELLCAELSVDGLPMDRGEAESIIASIVGPRATIGSRSRGPAPATRRRGAAAGARRRRCGPAQPRAREVAAATRRGRDARHPGMAARERCATRIRWSTPC